MNTYSVKCSGNVPGKRIDISVINYTPGLRPLQKLVGGYIESVRPDILVPGVQSWDAYDLIAWVDEEGKLKSDLSPSLFMWDPRDLKPYDVISGPVVFEAVTESGESAGLTPDDVSTLVLAIMNVYRAEVVYDDRFH